MSYEMKATFLKLRYFIPFLLLCLWFGNIAELNAFHVRSCDLLAKSDTLIPAAPLRFHFKMVTYIDITSGYQDFQADFTFSDGGKATVSRDTAYLLPNQTIRQVFYVSHTFPAPGIYTILYNEEFRNS